FGPGGVSDDVFAISDAAGTAGQVSGWSLVQAVRQPTGLVTTTGNFDWAAEPGHPLTVALRTLVNPAMPGTDVAGLMADFDPSRRSAWSAVTWAGASFGPVNDTALAAAPPFDTSGFSNPENGTFGWHIDAADRTLSLTYTPAPEPGAIALVGAAVAVGLFRRR